ncbi:MAG: serine hydrolase domain-containing protein [Gammaproteobacteria bacterium]
MQILKKILFSLFITFAIITCANAANLKESVDAVVNKAIQEKQLVGAVILIYQDGKEIYRAAHGLRDRENNIPMTDDTIFRFASLSKPITSVAVLKLIDEGKLNLDDPVTKYLPAFKPKTSDGKTPTITIRHLLSHMSGLSYAFFEFKGGPYHTLGISDGVDGTKITLDENLRRLASAPLLFEPGTYWHYSLGTDVLGAVLAAATGKSVSDAVDELVLKPLGMTHTGFILKEDPRLVSVPYADSKPEPVKMTDDYEMPFALSSVIFSPSRIFDKTAFPAAGGSMSGTADDYVKLLESIRLGTISLKKETLQMLTTNQIGSFSTTAGLGWGWSLGFAILTSPQLASSPQTKGTYQWGGIWGHAFWVDPQNKLTVVILTNTTIGGLVGRQLSNDIRNAIYAQIKNSH